MVFSDTSGYLQRSYGQAVCTLEEVIYFISYLWKLQFKSFKNNFEERYIYRKVIPRWREDEHCQRATFTYYGDLLLTVFLA